MKLSVIVPVRNDAVRLGRCLASLGAGQGLPNTEVIVADNGSNDRSPQVAVEMGARVISLPGLKVSALRNAAARDAKGELLGFVDADHELGSNWTAAAVEAMGDASVGAAGARYLPPQGGTWVQEAYRPLRGRTSGVGDTEWLGSGNMVVRRTAFEQVGGFDASLEACEDVDLCRRLRSAGFRIIGDERLRSIHHGDPATLAALFRAERWRGRDNLKVSLRGVVSWRDLPSIVTPLLSLAALVTLVVSPVIGKLADRPPVRIATASALLVLALAALRALRMSGNAERSSPLGFTRAFTVALVYDTARALALVSRAPHHRQ